MTVVGIPVVPPVCTLTQEYRESFSRSARREARTSSSPQMLPNIPLVKIGNQKIARASPFYRFDSTGTAERHVVGSSRRFRPGRLKLPCCARSSRASRCSALSRATRLPSASQNMQKRSVMPAPGCALYLQLPPGGGSTDEEPEHSPLTDNASIKEHFHGSVTRAPFRIAKFPRVMQKRYALVANP